MIGKTILKSIALPGEINPTSAETAMGQEQQVSETFSGATWKAFSGGFKVGFAFPFAVLFGMGGCSDRETSWVKVPGTDKTVGDAAGDASNDSGINVDAGTTAADFSSDNEDVGVDLELAPDAANETSDADLVDAEKVALPDAVTEDATLTDAAEDVALPQDAPADAAPDVYDSGICQYFCDAPLADVPKETASTGPVYSKMCSGGAYGVKTLLAPKGAVAAACTNETINYLIKGGNSCVAECGFYDNNVVLSTNPNQPVPFSTMLFAPPEVTKQSYTVTLTLHAPVFANNKTPALPGFMGSSFLFVFNQQLYSDTGKIVWDAVDKDGANIKGMVQVLFEPQDYFFNKPETLDITYIDLIGNKVSYRYPCDTLVDLQGVSNPIVNCSEVK
jgi:hypothetical protein